MKQSIKIGRLGLCGDVAVNCSVLPSKYIVNPLVKIKKDIDNIKMHGTTMKITVTSFNILYKCVFIVKYSGPWSYILSSLSREKRISK